MKILIAGYWTAPIRAIEHLLGSGYLPGQIGVLTHDGDARNNVLRSFTAAHHIETQIFSVKSPACYDWIRERGFDTVFSLYFREILPQGVLDLFGKRAVNLHAGLLPEYKGCWSSAWSILNGEQQSGFTYHLMTAEIDAGPILYREVLPIRPNDTAYSLYHRVLQSGLTQFPEILELIECGFEGRPQQSAGRYYGRNLPYGGYIDPSWDEQMVSRFIRAMTFPPFKGGLLRLADGSDREILSVEQYRGLVCHAS